MSRYSRTHIELSHQAIANNLQFIRKNFGRKRIHSCVVKGNAYGHGIEQFVPLLFNCGVRHFSVYSASEAYLVKKSLENNYKDSDSYTIMIMGDVAGDAIEWVIENDIETFVFDQYRLNALAEEAKKQNKKAFVHIEVETGMYRTGFATEDLVEVVHECSENQDWIQVQGICSHLAGSESIANFARVKSQIKIFQKASDFLQKSFPTAKRHLACSAACVRYPKTKLDLIRTGIITYGFWPSEETFVDFMVRKNLEQDPLQRVISWKSYVMSKKEVPRGQYIGYGNNYFSSQTTKIAVVPVGYETGFTRAMSNKGRVLIRGRYCRIIGIINMNCLTVDINHLTEVYEGDEVVLIGEQLGQTISVSSFSDLSDQLNYETLTRLPEDLPREVIA